MLFFRKEQMPEITSLPTVSELVQSFTGKFQEVAEANRNIISKQEEIITIAEQKRLAAESEKSAAEKSAAENFIANFNAMSTSKL